MPRLFFPLQPNKSHWVLGAYGNVSLGRLVKSIYETWLLHFHKNAFANFINVQGCRGRGRGDRGVQAGGVVGEVAN